MRSDEITMKACQIFLNKLKGETKGAKNFLQDADQNFYYDSEIWLTVNQQWLGYEMDAFIQDKALYAFMLYQADATLLEDTRFKRPTTRTLYPYGQRIDEFPFEPSSVYSVKDENVILNPLTLHSGLKSATVISALDYCIARYLESNDPYYFTWYYLSLGDILYRDMIKTEPLDETASVWFTGQLSIAMRVEADLLKLGRPAQLADLHRIMTGKYGSELRLLLDMESFKEQYGLHYAYKRNALHFFNSKYYSR